MNRTSTAIALGAALTGLRCQAMRSNLRLPSTHSDLWFVSLRSARKKKI